MTTSPIGKKRKSHVFYQSQKGISFFEVLVAVVILTTGLTAIYRSFFLTVDYLQYLSIRTQAQHLLLNKIASIEQDFKLLKDFDIGSMSTEMKIGEENIVFQYDIQLRPVDMLLSVFELDIALIWESQGKTNRIHQTAFFSGISAIEVGDR